MLEVAAEPRWLRGGRAAAKVRWLVSAPAHRPEGSGRPVAVGALAEAVAGRDGSSLLLVPGADTEREVRCPHADKSGMAWVFLGLYLVGAVLLARALVAMEQRWERGAGPKPTPHHARLRYWDDLERDRQKRMRRMGKEP